MASDVRECMSAWVFACLRAGHDGVGHEVALVVGLQVVAEDELVVQEIVPHRHHGLGVGAEQGRPNLCEGLGLIIIILVMSLITDIIQSLVIDLVVLY